MLIIDTSGSTATPSRGVLGSIGWGGIGGGLIRVPKALARESILGAEVTAALNFLAQVDGARTRLGVVTFAEGYGTANGGPANALVVQPLTFDQQAVRSALSRVLARGSDGGTDMRCPAGRCGTSSILLVACNYWTRSHICPGKSHRRVLRFSPSLRTSIPVYRSTLEFRYQRRRR